MKCSIEGCKNTHNRKIFTECDQHFSESFYATFTKLTREAFPEINGLPYTEPKNRYAKWVRDMYFRDDQK